MADKRGEKVEKFKLTDSQSKWLKTFRKIKGIERILQAETLKKKEEFSSLSQMWQSLQEGVKQLEMEIPEEQTRELQGMDFEEEERPQDYSLKY
jgi:acyl carrier protein phosphodiesterase